MKHTTLLFLLLAGAAAPLSAQNWFQNNPHWSNYFSAGFQGTGYEYVTVEKDTVLQGLPAVNLKRFHDMTYSNDFTDFRQVRQQGDTIWVWNDANEQFYVHYNFSLAVGDSVAAPVFWGGGQFKYYLDSIGTLTVDGQALRFQRVSFPSNYDYYQCHALIIETIGFVNGECFNSNTGYQNPNWGHFFPDEPNMGAVDGRDWRFCAYRNDLLDYGDSGSFCAGISGWRDPADVSTAFRIQPNPFRDVFSVVANSNQTASQLRIFDAGGRLALQFTFPFVTVSGASLPPGLYFLEITLADGKRQFCKAVKE